VVDLIKVALDLPPGGASRSPPPTPLQLQLNPVLTPTRRDLKARKQSSATRAKVQVVVAILRGRANLHAREIIHRKNSQPNRLLPLLLQVQSLVKLYPRFRE